MTIWDLERKILSNIPLSPEEFAVVEESVNSTKVDDQMLACDAMLRLGDSSQKERAQEVLSRIVEAVNTAQVKADANLVMAFFFLPTNILNLDPFRTCLGNCACHDDDGVRTNAMVVLGYLIKDGYKWPEEYLRVALNDASEEVRQNARSGLRCISKE